MRGHTNFNQVDLLSIPYTVVKRVFHFIHINAFQPEIQNFVKRLILYSLMNCLDPLTLSYFLRPTTINSFDIFSLLLSFIHFFRIKIYLYFFDTHTVYFKLISSVIAIKNFLLLFHLATTLLF